MSAINELVSDERIASLIEVLSFYSPEDKRLANNESDLASALRELQQCRAATACPAVWVRYGDANHAPDCTLDNDEAREWVARGLDVVRMVSPINAAPQVTSVPLTALANAIDAIADEVLAVDTIASTAAIKALFYRKSGEMRLESALAAPAVQAEQLSGNTELVSQPYTLPVDYLQGHKDGCEWSARMAEANHPQTGDWLFDDPIELAKAIRKGPDMLPAEPGNYPAIPDGSEDMLRRWLSFGKGMQKAGSHLPRHLIAETEAMLAAAPQQYFREIPNSSTNNCRENADSSTKCWCRTCRPITVTDMRFVVCPECGNKRCPHANDHRNACTGSNAPGQEGSAYPAAPKQEAE